MKTGALQSLDTSTELPVEQLYNLAVADFIQLHGEMAKLPADKNDPLQSLDSMLRGMGVERDNDMSMIMMGAMGKIGLDAVSSAFGVAANSPLTVATDIASSMYSIADEERSKPVFKRAQPQRPVFKRAKAPVVAPKKQPSFATSLLMGASRKQQPSLKHAEVKRAALKTQMEKRRAEIELMASFKSCGIKYARRVTKIDQAGQQKSMLIPGDTTAKVALTPERKPVDMTSTFKPRAPGMGMGMAA